MLPGGVHTHTIRRFKQWEQSHTPLSGDGSLEGVVMATTWVWQWQARWYVEVIFGRELLRPGDKVWERGRVIGDDWTVA